MQSLHIRAYNTALTLSSSYRTLELERNYTNQ
uniref:Uncharacterized protein n=1 Tax=Heterorhabditis bacteriophora TaxID=37862 RepID=A0A1I7XM85_HETBA